MLELTQAWSRPSRPRPIVIIGAGAIVRTAHLPAYRRLGLPVAGLFDIRRGAARETSQQFHVERIFESLDEAVATPGVVFDVAVPGDQIVGILEMMPPGSAVVIQKPMGENLAAARRIRDTCDRQALIAIINFQLRFAPNVLALRDLISGGHLGAITDVEVRLVVKQPWRQWSFLHGAPRVEVLYHSIHYIDALRWLVGEPRGVYCRVVAHPELPELADTRSSIILDYGDRLRCSLALNHTHEQGPDQRESMLKVEGTSGAALATMGVNLDYPYGLADRLEVALGGRGWQAIPLRGSWFTAAFEGPMSNLQRFVAGEDDRLVSPVGDAIKTMAIVEACYESSAKGGTPIPEP